ncbi:hypothetical protein ACQEU6_46265 [Spirillospora sp. CA-108201]
MAATPEVTVRHFVHVGKRKSGQSGRTEWRMKCSCGVEGLGRPTCRQANGDRDDHLREASDVPRGQQCTQLKAHRMLPGERCALCAGQLGLFDLDEMEVR